MSVPTLGDINVVCRDLATSLAFWRDGLGLEEVEREGGAVRLRLGNASLLLLPFAERPRPPAAYPAEATLGFDVLVDDVHDAVARLEAAGGERLRELGGEDGGRGWAVRDPDGNVVEVLGRV